MQQLLKHLVAYLIFGGTMFFSAGADALAGVDGGTGYDGGADLGDESAISDNSGGAESVDDSGASDAADRAADDGDNAARADQQRAADADKNKAKLNEDPDAKDFTGIVSNRLKGMVKTAPELGKVLATHPDIKNSIESAFRERMAYKEVMPTIAEARQFRERFPNGLADVEVLMSDVREVEELDQSFFSKDAQGNYAGHAKILDNIYKDDPEAAVALFRNIPKEWHRIDPDSYNEVMGQIVGATASARQWNERLADVEQFLKEGGDVKQAAAAIAKISGEINGFRQGKPKPTEEQQRLAKEKSDWQKQRAADFAADQGKFHTSFVAESVKLQKDIVAKHPAMTRLQKLVSSKAMSQEKYNKIVEEVRGKMKTFLANSPSFMRKLKPAHSSRDLKATIDLQKAAWSQSWLLNKMVREVLRVETPAAVNNSRDAAQRRAGVPPQRVTPGKPGAPAARTTNYQENGRWYRPNGSPFTTAEVLAGKHQA